MKEFSQEIINIDGVDYTLFLNRRGIVAWEGITKSIRAKNNLEEKMQNLNTQEDITIKDGDNPFEISNADAIIEADEISKELYKKLFWILLYENHKLNYSQVDSLFVRAVQTYGFGQLVELFLQMLSDANINKMENDEIKKLTALRPKK